MAPDGRLDAIFYDRRDDLDNVANDVFLTSSSDAGASFSPNLKLTSLPSSSEVGARYPIPSALGLVEIGSRLGLVSGEEEALAAWTDTRNSLPGEQQDIFATAVVLPTLHPGPAEIDEWFDHSSAVVVDGASAVDPSTARNSETIPFDAWDSSSASTTKQMKA
jgi:hypothetical protein